MRRAIALVFCLALIAAACGDDSATNTTDVPEGSVTVPDVVGESVAFATGVLEANGLVASVVEEAIDGAEPGTVVEQVPAAGATADEGATVVLRVAADTDATTTTTSGESGDSSTTTSGGSEGTTGTTGGGGSGTTAAPSTTAAPTTTEAAQVAPDDGGTGEIGEEPPEHSVTVVAENNNPEAVVFTGEISVPGDRGDGIHITVDNLRPGNTSANNANTQVTFVCSPGGPEVRDQRPSSSLESAYSGGESCDAAYSTSFFSTVDSDTDTYYIYVPDGVEGYFEYTLTLVSVRS